MKWEQRTSYHFRGWVLRCSGVLFVVCTMTLPGRFQWPYFIYKDQKNQWLKINLLEVTQQVLKLKLTHRIHRPHNSGVSVHCLWARRKHRLPVLQGRLRTSADRISPPGTPGSNTHLFVLPPSLFCVLFSWPGLLLLINSRSSKSAGLLREDLWMLFFCFIKLVSMLMSISYFKK